MNRFKKYLLVTLSLLLSSVTLLFIDGFYWPTQKPCRPIAYPSGEKVSTRPTIINDFSTQQDIGAVNAFYKDLLNPSTEWEVWQEDGWKIEQVNEGTYIYECFSRQKLAIGQTAEQGCIYVQREDRNTLIRTVLFQKGDYVPCPIAPSAYSLP